MKFAFRTDASIQIGTGHVMRCLTLANALAAKGAECTFICREHSGNLIEHIRSKGHSVYGLPLGHDTDIDLVHSAWLGATQAQDAKTCLPLVAELQSDWLVVDHYALDARWEDAVANQCRNLMVIDDLADRKHACRLLLDQTFGRDAKDYRSLVPKDCTLLCGSNYVLLRPEFLALRPYSLERREQQPQLKHLLITMGGVDKDNVTSQVLDALRSCPLPADCEITLVMGAIAPWLTHVEQQVQTMPWPINVRVGVSNMAELMADSDLAIGAAGATSWERCCLGLPTIMVVLAENQNTIAEALSNSGAVERIEIFDLPHLLAQMPLIRGDLTALTLMTQAARKICTGEGTSYLVSQIMKEHHEDNAAL